MSRARGGRIGLRFRHSDGSMGKTIELQAPPDFTVTIDGKPRKHCTTVGAVIVR